MKKIIFIIGLMLPLLSSGQSPRQQITINSCWKFIKSDVVGAHNVDFDDSTWETVNLPHTWNALDILDEVKGYHRGIAWYRHWEYIAVANKNTLILRFEAVGANAEVYVNGKKVGIHKGAFTAFQFDITPYVNYGGKNLIAVKADNSHDETVPPLHGDFSIFGGIYRDVSIMRLSDIHFVVDNLASQGVFLSTPFISEQNASLKIAGNIFNNDKNLQKLSVNIVVYDPSGKEKAKLTTKLNAKPGVNTSFELTSSPIAKPNLWTPEEPTLYQVKIQINDARNSRVYDELIIPYGFRWFGIDAAKGFLLNGKPYKLKGAARHQDFEGIGNALPDALHRNDMKLLKAMGANYVRICHYPQDPAIYDICDKLGLIVWSEIPNVDHIGMTKSYFNNAVVMMKEMILQNFNHPSVAMWGYMNEVFGYLDWYMKSASEQDKKKLMDETAVLARLIDSTTRAMDPSRLTVIAMHTDPYPLYYKESGLLDIAQINGWNIYQGWYHNNLDSLGSVIDYLYHLQPNTPVFISEYGAESDPRINTYQPSIFDNSSQYQEMFNEKYLEEGNKRDYVVGFAIWNLIDFQREGRSDAVRAINNKGMLTTDRKTKNVYYLNQAHWSTTPMLKIASEFWESRTEVSDSTILKRPIMVYTNQASAELFHNGKSLGKKAASNKKILWMVPMTAGKNDLLVTEGNLRDFVSVDYTIIPKQIKNNNDWDQININVGQTRTYFTDKTTLEQWIPCNAYTPGSFGYIGGEVYNTWPDMKAWQGIREGVNNNFNGTANNPIYQTFLTGIEKYRFDVQDGTYEITLHFAEPFDESKRKNVDLLTGADADGVRVFSVFVNNEKIIEHLNLDSQYGSFRAVSMKFVLNTEKGKGIEIRFDAIKGKPILNGIQLRKY